MKDNNTSGSASTEEKLEIVIAPPHKKLEEFNVDVSKESSISMVLRGNVKEKQIKSSTKEDETVPVKNSTSFSKDQIETRNRHFKLYRAALAGDWNSAEKIFKEDKIYITAKLSKEGETALHIAAAAMSTGFVKKLLEQMKREDLAIKNNAGNTAFFLAAASGIVEIVKAMMEKNKDLVKIRGSNDMLPLHKATLMGNKKMVEYLYEVTGDELLDDNDRFELLISLLNHDIALDLVERHPETAIVRDENKETALHYLARMPGQMGTVDFSVVTRCKRSVIYLYNEVKRDVVKKRHSMLGRQGVKERGELCLRDRINEREQRWRNRMGWRDRIKKAICEVHYIGDQTPHAAFELVKFVWEQVMLLDDSQILEIIRKPRSLILEAAKQGNLAVLTIIFCAYPDLMFEVDENHYTIFHYAVMYRHYSIFRIIYNIGSLKDLIIKNTDEEGNNILHLAAKLPPPERPNNIESAGALYQLQDEMFRY
ncbi:hypothetical protein Pint_12291 [Pistacia integerrima]|uniref:Uncharacterized protein n=1 Tax=Pistacia integerrima TaxID=434235 RepID=A0ACC0XM86_9ROSI|nr:hypothetical protein Pint_12291 [Pistacia integerrima]